MNILQLSVDYPPHVIWGSGTHCAGLASGLAASGDRVLVVTPYYYEGPSGLSTEGGVDVLRVQLELAPPDESLSSLDQFRAKLGVMNAELVRAALDSQPYAIELIHVHNWMSFPAADQLRRTWDCPLVTTLHVLESEIANFVDSRELFELAEHGETRLLNTVDAAILPSRYLNSRLPEARFPRGKRHIIPIGVDLEKFTRSRPERHYNELRARLSSGDKIVLFVGRLDLQKGWSIFLSASQHVVTQDPDTVFVVVGRGKDMMSLLQMVSTLDNIVITGYLPQEEVFDLYQVADVAVVPSLFENFPASVFEALASGCAVVAADVGGVGELIESGLNGLLVPVDLEGEMELPRIDARVLAEHILLLLRDEELRSRLKRNAKEFALQNLSRDRMISETRNLYQDLLSCRCKLSSSITRAQSG